MIRRPPRSTLFPYTSSSDHQAHDQLHDVTREPGVAQKDGQRLQDRKSKRLNSSHRCISYAVFCLKKKIYVNLALDFPRHHYPDPLTHKGPVGSASYDHTSTV